HLEQLDETVGRPLQRRRLFAEEDPSKGAKSEPDKDLSREGHEADRARARSRPPLQDGGRGKTLPNYGDSHPHSRRAVTVAVARDLSSQCHGQANENEPENNH